MIIRSCVVLEDRDVGKAAWARLKRYFNVDYVAERLVVLHGLSRSQLQNTRRQATQLKHCLLQASEYFDAARRVSLATQPVLLYYGTMSMALCEILFKQTGNSRLDKLREQHGSHGLRLSVRAPIVPTTSLADAAASLQALPEVRHGLNVGTFNVWHRSSREYPAIGYVTLPDGTGNASVSQFRVVLEAEDSPPAPIPKSGFSLLHVFQGLPYMAQHLLEAGCEPLKVRTTLKGGADDEGKDMFSLIVHPYLPHVIEQMADHIRVEPRFAHQLTVTELHNGFGLSAPLRDGIRFSVPWSTP